MIKNPLPPPTGASKATSFTVPGAAILWGCTLALFLFLLPFLLFVTQRMGYDIPLSWAEGWNAYATSRFLQGGPLYLPLTGGFPVTIVNYPPLSFVLIAGIAHLTGHLVFVGRCVAFAAFLFVAVLIFGIIRRFQPNRLTAAIGALFWLTLVIGTDDQSVGAYEPSMLGHAFSLGALALYTRWCDHLSPRRVGMLAFLCCLALFIKPSFVAVPITLAVLLMLRDRTQFGLFVAVGTTIGIAMFLGSWLVFGGDLVANLLTNPLVSNRPWNLWRLLVARLTIAYLVFPSLFLPRFLYKMWKTWPMPLVYFCVSALTAAYFFGFDGAGENLWFDFFIAVSIGWGLFAGQLTASKPVYAPWFVGGLLMASLAMLLRAALAPSPGNLLDYATLRREARTYQDEVALLRSTPGPALFEVPLVGFDAGKAFIFDPFWGTELIVTGHLSERALTDRIRAREFSVIALAFDLDRRLAQNGTPMIDTQHPVRTVTGRWTDNTLRAISKHYQLLDHQYSYLYVPRSGP